MDDNGIDRIVVEPSRRRRFEWADEQLPVFAAGGILSHPAKKVAVTAMLKPGDQLDFLLSHYSDWPPSRNVYSMGCAVYRSHHVVARRRFMPGRMEADF